MDLRPIIDREMDRIMAAIAGSPTRTEIRLTVVDARRALHAKLNQEVNITYSQDPDFVKVDADTRWP